MATGGSDVTSRDLNDVRVRECRVSVYVCVIHDTDRQAHGDQTHPTGSYLGCLIITVTHIHASNQHPVAHDAIYFSNASDHDAYETMDKPECEIPACIPLGARRW